MERDVCFYQGIFWVYVVGLVADVLRSLCVGAGVDDCNDDKMVKAIP